MRSVPDGKENATGGETELLLDWMNWQYAFSAAAMLRAVSATGLVKERRGFGQTIRPSPGSILASPEIASYDPDPDYFFHWLRDSALVMDALRALIVDRAFGPDVLQHFSDFIDFSLALCRLDGGEFVKRADFGATIDPASRVYARSADELSRIVGDRVLGEPRFNPDATLDVINGDARSMTGPRCARLRCCAYGAMTRCATRLNRSSLSSLLEQDLDFTLHHFQEPCFDLWEETFGHHYHTRLVQFAALGDGAVWMDETGDPARASAYRAAALELRERLDAHFDAATAYMSATRSTPWKRRVSPTRSGWISPLSSP